MMNLKQIAVCILISALLPMTVYFSLDYFYAEYKETPELVAVRTDISNLQNKKWQLTELLNSLKNESGGIDKENQEKYSQLNKELYKLAEELYKKNIEQTDLVSKFSKFEKNYKDTSGFVKFWIYLILGFISILFGFYLTIPGLNAGLILGGLILVFYGYGVGWSSINPLIRTVSLVILLCSVIFIALFRNKEE